MKKYPPFVNAYGKIPDLFTAIKSASVPPKFTYDFLNTSLGLKSSSFRAMIPLLKKLGFLDQANVPTQVYKDFRDDEKSGTVLANKIKEAYSDVYTANEYAHQLSKKDLVSKLKTVLGVSDDDQNLPYVAGTFLELVKLANFKATKVEKNDTKTKITEEESILPDHSIKRETRLGISYTINLNLPATTEIEVFNAIFKALKEHIIYEE